MIQQTIQEVKFEDIILSKKQRQARKTSKLRHWLQYLNMLDENKDHKKKNSVIRQMHSMFILRQDFWIKEAHRVLDDTKNLNTESFQFAFMALEDGFYLQVVHLIAQKLFEAFIEDKLRVNYVIAKLQILISHFDFFTKECALLYDILIKVYTKINNVKKIRETFQRQISLGFDDYDVSYAKYIKWQEKELKMSSINEVSLLEKGKSQWQRNKIFVEDQLPKLQISQDFLESQEVKNNPQNIKRCLVYLQDLNRARIDGKKYMKLLDMLSFDKEKLWYLRRLAMSETHELVQQYFQTLELSRADDQEIINIFKVSMRWQNGEKYEKLYLSFLIRRINKHVLKPQSQEYNNQWGSNVEHFRNQISQLISKQRLNTAQTKEFTHKYYYLWIEVEMALVKDKDTIEKLFQSLLEWEQTQQIYIDYANAMIKLGDVVKAKFILNKTFETYGLQSKVIQQYEKFLSIYGSLADIVKFKKHIETLTSELHQKHTQIITHQENHKQNHQDITSKKDTVKLNSKKKEEKIIQSVHSNQSTQNSPSSQKNHKENYVTEDEPKFLKRQKPVQNNHQIENHTQKKKIHLDSHNTLFSNKINKNWGESDIMLNLIFKQNVNDIRIVEKQNEKICYIQFDSEQTAKKQLNQNKSPLNLAFSRPPSKTDDKTLFLCNLPLETSSQQIKNIIPSQLQDLIKEIRCKQKGDKKTAYIQFNSQQVRDEVLSQLKKQKIKIGNRSIIALSCSNDHKDSKQKKNKTIFLKNLSFKCKQKDIKSFFEEKGFSDIVQIFIPKDQKTNRSKGYAYVQFTAHEDAQKAYQLQKGQILGRQFAITRSDRAITHHESQQDPKKHEKDRRDKPKQDNKRSNNFFSNIFS